MSHRAPDLSATVIIPTSIDRGPVLRLAVESVLRQTVSDLEVFIIGDGVHENTRQTALELQRTDSRVRFFDHPKHPRRGETYRHEALQEARGRIVCYLCDRDLYLPHHVEEQLRLLSAADFAHTLPVRLRETGDFWCDCAIDISNPEDRFHLQQASVGGREIIIPLSFGAHTLDAYRRLSEGWATTPSGPPTDLYFWSKFARDPRMKLASGVRPTLLYLPRGDHPGWTTAERLPELSAWSHRIQSPAEVQAIESAAITAAITTALIDRAGLGRFLRHPLLLSGEVSSLKLIYRFFSRRLKKIRRLLNRPSSPAAPTRPTPPPTPAW